MKDYLGKLKDRIQVLETPYLQNLRNRSFDRDDFIETQIQFLFAVVFFSRPMLTLAARLPRPEMRLGLLQNITDEHGDDNLTNSHEATFLELLDRLGTEKHYINTRKLWPEVRAFNTALIGVTTIDEPLTGLACLGIIEDLFATISADIGASIVENRWLEQESLVHYTLHEKLDEIHAEDFYRLLYNSYYADQRAQYAIQQGLELGAYIFLQMYDGLFTARARRWSREIGGPHSMCDGWFLK